MYNGELITLRIKDRSALLCISMLDLSGELIDNKLFLRDTKKNKDIGYLCAVYGISINEFMKNLGFEIDENIDIAKENNV